jgi:hypothetical protein
MEVQSSPTGARKCKNNGEYVKMVVRVPGTCNIHVNHEIVKVYGKTKKQADKRAELIVKFINDCEDFSPLRHK